MSRILFAALCATGLSACVERTVVIETSPFPSPAVAYPAAPMEPDPSVKRIRNDGEGGLILPDGTRVALDNSGGFVLPNGEYVRRDSRGGLNLPNGTRCFPDSRSDFVCP